MDFAGTMVDVPEPPGDTFNIMVEAVPLLFVIMTDFTIAVVAAGTVITVVLAPFVRVEINLLY
jgi:hypothetical protein